MKRGRSFTEKKLTGSSKTGQTICNVTDSKIIKVFVDDEPFWLSNVNLLKYHRRLNMKSGTLDRENPLGNSCGKTHLDQIIRSPSTAGSSRRFLLCDAPQCEFLDRDLFGGGA